MKTIMDSDRAEGPGECRPSDANRSRAEPESEEGQNRFTSRRKRPLLDAWARRLALPHIFRPIYRAPDCCGPMFLRVAESNPIANSGSKQHCWRQRPLGNLRGTRERRATRTTQDRLCWAEGSQGVSEACRDQAGTP